MLLPALGALQTESGGIRAAVGNPTEEWPINFPYESVEALNPFFVAVGRFDAGYIAGNMELIRRSRDGI
jgi:hypothetical protein